MKLLNLFLIIPYRAKPGEIKIYAQAKAGQAVYHSLLPFFEYGNDVPDRWRNTMMKAKGAVAFESDKFSEEEVEWMAEQGWLTREGNHFHPQRLKKIGQDIYNTLFPPGDGRDLLHRMLGSLEPREQLHIQIQFSENIDQRGRLTDYPWELACKNHKFLAKGRVTFSRLIAFFRNIPKLPPVEKIKVLLVSSPVGDRAMDLPPLDSQEQRAILKGIKQAEAKGKIELFYHLNSPTLKEFGDYLTQISGDKTPHIIHFDGHGVFGQRCNQEQCRTIHQLRATKCRKCGYPLDPFPQGYLLFKANPEDGNKEADYISATEISELIQKSNIDLEQKPDQGIRLVVISACKTGMALGSDSVFKGVAQKLIEQQIPAVVAMPYHGTVKGATAFAERFYRALGNKKTITTALTLAQGVMSREGNQFYHPLLYLRWYDQEGGQLFGNEQPELVMPSTLSETLIPQSKEESLKQFSFEVVTVNRKGTIIKRESQQARYFTEYLGNGVNLEMVYIPAGSFVMGSPESEKGSDGNERPQHQVRVQAFFLGKYQVTQAQWRAVANLPIKTNWKLKPNPSYFKGNNRPVELVSWSDAKQFCRHLSDYTGTEYRLPSEAEWEYACRAGTTTPFHYGETITSKLANYNSNTYAEEAKGKYRGETTPVGSFPPNRFGLYDMHGNVWEYCEDNCHKNYFGAPTDGSIWSNYYSNDGHYELVRGGSWYDSSSSCRSASRSDYDLSCFPSISVGFRVVRVVGRSSP